nr:substrate-binding domain-containing protein [Halomicroarcula sp. SYNS111]
MPIQRRQFIRAVGVGAVASVAGCSQSGGQTAGESESQDRPGVAGETLTLTTTTSTYDTGLLDAIHPDFETMYGVTVDAVAQGTGAALESARNGDSDVVMVHARGLEDEFMRNGYGVNRRDLMFNDFVIVGPEGDPAGIQGMGSATEALTAIAESGSTFVSRGDNSGTHTKELNLWAAAGTDPGGDWYQETGTGMGEALNVATQQGAYTLSDRGTFISQRSEIDLVILVQGPIGRPGDPGESLRSHGGQPRRPRQRELRPRDGLHRLDNQPRRPGGHRGVSGQRRAAVLPRSGLRGPRLPAVRSARVE